MTTCYLAPDPIQSTQFIPGGNTPANGGQLFFYTAGSSTKTTVYKDSAGNTAWSNPIVLDSGGNLPSGGEVWIPTGVTVKVIFAPSNDTDPPASPYWTKDNLPGINDTTSSPSEWITGPAPTFVSATQFIVSGDQTSNFHANRRLKTTNTGGTIYSEIASVVFTSGSTTINVVSDSGSLDSGLSAVSYGVISAANTSIDASIINRKGAAVASAGNGTTNIWGTVGNYAHVTGTNTIANFSSAPYAGARKELIFDGALTLINSVSIDVPGAANVSTAAGDRAIVVADTVSTTIITQYTRDATGVGAVKLPTLTNLYIATGTATSSGTYTPPAGATRLHGRMVGGGGGGAGAPAGSGTAGSSTTFGGLTAGGGGAGAGTGGGAGGTNTTTGTAFSFVGAAGGGGEANSAAGASPSGGIGGISPFGGGGSQGAGASNGGDGAARTGSGGGGGGGGSGTNSAGGGGAGGYVEFYNNIPASTSFAYSIGPGGTGGASTSAGGNGAGGSILIEEYYS